MPHAPLRGCTAPGCPNKVPGGRCERHRLHHKRQRLTWTQVYGPDWPDIRLDYLERHPVCALCPRQATTPDHYPVGIRDLRARGIVNPHADRYLRPLCASCHSRHTGRSTPAGWNNRYQ
jgi:5-methylcytosine-specific restriction protein A